MTADPVPLPSALPLFETLNIVSASHESDAPLAAVKVIVEGPAAASGWAPKGSATGAAAKVLNIAGALNTAVALLEFT